MAIFDPEKLVALIVERARMGYTFSQAVLLGVLAIPELSAAIMKALAKEEIITEGYLSREGAIQALQRISFTRKEAERTIDAPDEETRKAIHLQVQERVKYRRLWGRWWEFWK